MNYRSFAITRWRFSSNFARPPSCERRAIERFHPFIFIRNKCRVISSDGYSALEITPLYVLRGLCCPSRQEQQPAADWNGQLVHFLNLNLLGRVWESPLQTLMAVWRASTLKRCTKQPLLYLQWAATPDQITQQNSLHRAGDRKRQ